ncbi:hypothetical protein CVU76_02390 [Candidatus Dojkabacteria bacterium HGW-Dojkabacteria-1]|uniref:Uncharacterized protein n=1 Tax=Candidatus Dojkabacteria bacterium HGW-Dojkabacteria-1 TaxID=2013761 RepID=A0A2N2F3R9_9BACT|nr:MAG: hypothetical protein CVU76_02390 [Candidatus Dojkabacteria bacterium HGW-Dojkabacteria-1]
MDKNTKSTASRITEAVFGILFNLLFYYLLNRFYTLVPFLNEDFERILPIYNLAIMVSIFIHASRILFESKIYKDIGEIVNTGFFVYIAYLLWTIFPFNLEWFNNTALWNILIRFLIVVPAFIAFISAFVSLFKTLIDIGRKV